MTTLTIEEQLEQTINIGQLINLTLNHGKKIADNKPRIIHNMEVGDTVSQGDLYFTRIDIIPYDSKELKRPKKILGTAANSTKGRHKVINFKSATAYRLPNWRRNNLHGYLLNLWGEKLEVDHPEHANVIFLRPKHLEVDDFYLILVHYQREHGEELRPVVD